MTTIHRPSRESYEPFAYVRRSFNVRVSLPVILATIIMVPYTLITLGGLFTNLNGWKPPKNHD